MPFKKTGGMPRKTRNNSINPPSSTMKDHRNFVFLPTLSTTSSFAQTERRRSTTSVTHPIRPNSPLRRTNTPLVNDHAGPNRFLRFHLHQHRKRTPSSPTPRVSCGCTVPQWPKEPIMKGQSGTIKVTFNSTGKLGVQDRTVTITSNAKQNPMVLHLKGTVDKTGRTTGRTTNEISSP